MDGVTAERGPGHAGSERVQPVPFARPWQKFPVISEKLL